VLDPRVAYLRNYAAGSTGDATGTAATGYASG